MKNYYSTIDGIRLTFSNIEEDKDGFENITFYYERENKTGFDFAEGKPPENWIYKSCGFTEDELLSMQEYIKNNSFLIWEIAKEKSVEYSAVPKELLDF